ncbi:MAG TPA: hemolysin family protein [Acidimicrobiia bacterium]|nr:hemolysin family protein [Acidimicrobiia bacterium]
MTVTLAADITSISPGLDPTALLIGLALLITNGFFVAAEIALLAANRAQVEARAEQGDAGAVRALKALRELSITFSGAQLGITMCSLGLGAVAEPALASVFLLWMEPLGLPAVTASVLSFVVALSLVVFLHMVVGEMVPKNLALADAERLASRVSLLFGWYVKLFRPLIVLLNGAANALVRLTGIEPVEEIGLVHTPDELRMALRESLRTGLIAPAQVRVLSAVLALGDIDAESAMTPRIDLVTVDEHATVEEILTLAAESGHSRLPVRQADLDHIIGVVHVKDLLIADERELDGKTARDLRRPMPVVPESRDLDQLLNDMRSERSHLALVIDEYGGTAGVLTLEDILEELVGEIADEFDPTEWEPRDRGGAWVVTGSMRRDELQRLTGLELPEGETETVSGAISETLGRLPHRGDLIEHRGWTLRVLTMDGRRAGQVEVVAPPPTGSN